MDFRGRSAGQWFSHRASIREEVSGCRERGTLRGSLLALDDRHGGERPPAATVTVHLGGDPSGVDVELDGAYDAERRAGRPTSSGGMRRRGETRCLTVSAARPARDTYRAMVNLG